jgi:hypothetical protein
VVVVVDLMLPCLVTGAAWPALVAMCAGQLLW